MSIAELRIASNQILMIGSHPGIIQSILDYDYLINKEQPSIIAILANGRKQERYFWGESELLISVYSSVEAIPQNIKTTITATVNVQSARRVLSSTKAVIESIPSISVAVLFAEQTPEKHSLELRTVAKEHNVLIIGPASVGILLPGYTKIGAIGGTEYAQLQAANIDTAGDTAVISTSGGMVNELIHMVTSTNKRVSFAVALGGDHFPVTNAVSAMLLAEQDPHTKQIVYFGELGGTTEYELAKLIDAGKITKRIIAYIGGVVAELFETPPQFGHAGALAETHDESATAKKDRLRQSGVVVCDSLRDMPKEIMNGSDEVVNMSSDTRDITSREHSLFVSHLSGEKDGEMQLLGSDLMTTVEQNSLASLVLSMILGQQVTSKKAIEFTDFTLRLLVDHGPYVSGSVNTMVTARAGRDLVSGLVAGLLTIGPRFGGAINAAAEGWLRGVETDQTARQYVESFTANGGIISGIGHKKYRIDTPDPRVALLKERFSGNSNNDRYLTFATSVEAMTTTKKGNLILNIDGAIAAIMLDILESELHLDQQQLKELVDIEFFNALFVLARSIGFTSHYLDQRRYDEGLFRLDSNDVRYIG